MNRWNQAPLIREQVVLFSPTLDAAISEDHSVRLVDEVLRQMDWSAWESRYFLLAGQPPIHPRIVAGAILYGLTLSIRSSRKLEDACRNRMDFLWLVEGREIDHSTFANFRTRFDKELKLAFRQIILLARGMGVACLNQVCSDGTRVLANNARYNTARQGKLKELEAQIDQQIAELLKSAEEEDRKDQQLFGAQATPGKLPVNLRNAKQRKARLQEARAQLDEMQEKRGARKDVSAKGPQIPLADPDARVLPNKQGGYAPNCKRPAKYRCTGCDFSGVIFLNRGWQGELVVEPILPAHRCLGGKVTEFCCCGTAPYAAALAGADGTTAWAVVF